MKGFKRITSALLIVCLIVTLLPQLTMKASAQTQNTNPEKFANVVIFAYFNGDTGAEDYFSAKRISEIKNMYDGSYGRSFSSYLKTISDGQFEVQNIYPQDNGTTLTPYCITSTNLQAALTSSVDETIIREIMTNVPEITDSSVNLDYNKDGCIDNFTIILYYSSGNIVEENGAIATLHSHKADYNGEITWSGKTVSAYNMIDTKSIDNTEAGVMAHEFLHTLGYPDLYNNDTSRIPVHIWDIMASVSKKQSYPLAYMRMKVKNWLTIDEVTTSKKLTLYTQDQADKDRAFILKSPLSEMEFFVVEFRKSPASRNTNQYVVDNDSLDYYVGESGIIVYRINTRVEELSNFAGDAVYVFRPQEGQLGYDSTEQGSLLHATLSAETGRTTIGSTDMAKTLKDGALTFSDGTNSGIVISNVSSAAGDSITFDVSIPDASEFDAWTNMNFRDTANGQSFGKTLDIESFNDKLYMVTYNDNDSNKISLWTENDGTWVKAANDISTTYGLSSVKLKVHNNELYMAYEAYDSIVHVNKLNTSSNTWTSVASVNGNGYFCLDSINGKLYITHIESEGWNGYAKLSVLEGSSFTELGSFAYGSFGETSIAAIGNDIYVAVRESNDKIDMFKYNSSGSFTDISNDDLKANTYGMVSSGNKIYVTLGGGKSKLKLYKYDGDRWSETSSEIECFQPRIVSSNGNIYLLLVPDANSNIQVVRYDAVNDTFVEEGINIDGYPSAADFISIGDTLYAAYVRDVDQKITVKKKEAVEVVIDAKPNGHTLSLEGKIAIKFYMILSDEVLADSDAYMQFDLPDGTQQKVKISEAIKYTGTVTEYAFPCYVKSNQMEDVVTAQMYSSDGTKKLSEKMEYCVEDYVSVINGMTSSQAQRLQPLTDSMSEYGRYAKALFTDKIVLEETDALKAVTADTLKKYEQVKEGTVPTGLTDTGVTLELNSDTSIKFYFKVSEGHDISEYTFTVDGNTYTPIKYNDEYVIVVENVVSYDLNRTYTLVVNGQYTKKYSALSYAYSILSKTGNDSLKSLVKAMYLYSKEADAYFGK